MDFAGESYRLADRLTSEERYGLISQIKRAAASVPANIAEGYGRLSHGDLLRFLRIANGSLREAESHILLACQLGLVSPAHAQPVLDRADEVGRLLFHFRRALTRQPGTRVQIPES